MRGIRGRIQWLAAITALVAASFADAAMWYIPFVENTPGGVDHIQILMSTDHVFDTPAMSVFFSIVPEGEQWQQIFRNDKGTFAAASGPNLGAMPLAFDIWVDGDRNVDRPIIHYQAYRDGQLVSSVDLFCVGFGELDWEVRPGTWIANRPSPDFLPGDADRNSLVDIEDLYIWQTNYTGLLGTGKTWDEGDWNGDGAVDVSDLYYWQINYTGVQPMPSLESIMAGVRAVPEPGALAVIALAAVALVARRRGQ